MSHNNGTIAPMKAEARDVFTFLDAKNENRTKDAVKRTEEYLVRNRRPARKQMADSLPKPNSRF